MNVFEKLREKLEMARNSSDWIELEDAMDIIDQVEEEHNNGWISVDDKMAVNLTEIERKLVLDTLKGYIDIMNTMEVTEALIGIRLDNGLSTAIQKIEKMKTRG